MPASDDRAVGRAGEPNSPDAVRSWIDANVATRDRFGHVRDATDEHRRRHGCVAHPTGNAALLGVLAGALRAQRVLELGCGLGYSALWLAHGTGPGGVVESVDHDAGHVDLARRHVADEGYQDRVRVVLADATAALEGRREPCDLVFLDASVPSPALLDPLAELVRAGGFLVSANLFLARHDPNLPGLGEAAAYRTALLDDDRWLTSFAGEKAISLRR